MSLQQLAATPLPIGFDDSALYLRRWLLDLRLMVSANEVKRRAMLKDAIHAHIQTAFGEAIEALVDEATDQLYEKLKADPADEWPEQEADDGEGLPLNLPGRDPE